MKFKSTILWNKTFMLQYYLPYFTSLAMQIGTTIHRKPSIIVCQIGVERYPGIVYLFFYLTVNLIISNAHFDFVFCRSDNKFLSWFRWNKIENFFSYVSFPYPTTPLAHAAIYHRKYFTIKTFWCIFSLLHLHYSSSMYEFGTRKPWG